MPANFTNRQTDVLTCDQCGKVITLQHAHGLCSDECHRAAEDEGGGDE